MIVSLFYFVALLQLCAAFSPRSSRRTSTTLSMLKDQLVLIRHGESTWNDLNKFTGWYDCPLSDKGKKEAKDAGKLLAEGDFKFDLAFTSYQQRAIRTLWYALEATDFMYIPIKNAWQLNERHYGALQGLDKKETMEKYGSEQVNIWRRSYDTPPPEVDTDSPMFPGNDPKYKDIREAANVRTESLALTLDRVLPYWNKEILPELKAGKRILISAHGNSLRALVKHLDNISEEEIAGLNIPTGVPLVYSFDDDMNIIPQSDGIAPLTGRYVGDIEDIKERIMGVVNQTK